MTEVIRGEFAYQFEFHMETPRFVSISGTAVVEYEAECYSKSEGWSVESISISEMTINEAFNEEGNTTSIDSNEVICIADYIHSKESSSLVEKALDDAMERSFWD